MCDEKENRLMKANIRMLHHLVGELEEQFWKSKEVTTKDYLAVIFVKVLQIESDIRRIKKQLGG